MQLLRGRSKLNSYSDSLAMKIYNEKAITEPHVCVIDPILRRLGTSGILSRFADII